MVPSVEKAMVDNGIILIKYWLNVSATSRPGGSRAGSTTRARSGSSRPTDLKSYSRRYDYCRARDAMLAATDSGWAPWYVVDNDDKKRGRLNIITHLLEPDPVRAAPRPMDVKMPKPPSPSGYVEPESSRPNIPTPF